jgi:hypothetical protein
MMRVQLMDDETWDLRFRLLGVELMQAPLFGLAVLQLGLLLYAPRFSASSRLFDSLFTRRRNAPPSRHQPLPSTGRRRGGEALAVNGLEGGDVDVDVDGGNGDVERDGEGGENEDGEDDRDGMEEDQGGVPLPEDLPALLTRAGSVGGVPSPMVFFEAQALEEMA